MGFWGFGVLGNGESWCQNGEKRTKVDEVNKRVPDNLKKVIFEKKSVQKEC